MSDLFASLTSTSPPDGSLRSAHYGGQCAKVTQCVLGKANLPCAGLYRKQWRQRRHTDALARRGPLAVEPASVPKPLFWLSLPLGRVLRSLELFRAPTSPPDGGSDQRASRRGRARGALSRHSGHRSSSVSVGAAKKYRHTGHCRFTMPGSGSQGWALIALTTASGPLVGAAVSRRFLFMSAFLPSVCCFCLRPWRLGAP